MSASLGLFSVDLEAKIANFVSDWGRAEREAAKQMRAIQATVEQGFKKVEEAGHRAREGIAEAVSSLTGFTPSQLGIAAVVGGLGEVTKKAIETGDQLNKMSQKVGISVDALAGLSYSAKLADVDTEALGGGLAKFAKTASAAAGGSKEQAAAFKAIGVSVTDASGKIRPMEELIGDVAEKFAGFEDDANKTALAIALFGKSGAQLIPFLNAGKHGIHEMSAEAKALGLNFADIAKPSEDFNDNLTRMGQAAIGVGADIARELLPRLIEAEEAVLRWIKATRQDGTIQQLAHAVGFLVENLDTLAVIVGTRLALGAVISAFTALTAAVTASGAAAAIAEGAFALLGGPVGVIALAAGAIYYFSTQEDIAEQSTNALKKAQDALAGATNESRVSTMQALSATKLKAEQDLKAAEAVLARYEAEAKLYEQLSTQTIGGGSVAGMGGGQVMAGQADRAGAKAEQMRSHIADLRSALSDANIELNLAQMRIEHTGESAKKAAPNFTSLAKAMGDDAAKAASKFAEMLNKDGETIAALQGKLNPAQKLYSEYAKGIIEANAAYQKELDLAKIGKISAEDLARAKQALITKTELLQEVQRSEEEAYRKSLDIVTKYLDKISDESALIGLSEREKEITKAVQDLTREWNNNVSAVKEWARAHGIADPTLANVQQRIRDETGALYDNKQAWELNQQATRDWVSIFSSAADRMLSTSGNLWSRIKGGAKDMVDSIISYIARLSVINPILNSLFGGLSGAGFSMLPTMANAFGGNGGGGTALNQTGGIIQSIASAFSGGGGTDGATGNGGGFDWTSGASWLNAGKSLWQGFSGGFSALWNGPQVPGISSMTQDANGIYRASYGNVSPGVDMSHGGYSSGFTQALGIAAGIYAGYNRAQNADGAFGKIGGGLAYGVGTYYAGAAVSAALAGGVSAGLAAIPVVGWIALAAMLVDKFSGGKLFGTSYHPESATGAINIGEAGGTASATVHEVKQQSLFRGRKWRDSAVDPGDDARDAAVQFFAAIKQAMTAAANATGDALAPVIDASIRTVTEYDKKGRVTATKYFADVLGRTWEETSAELAAKRVQAEALVKQVDVSAHGAASALAEQFRSDAEKLFDAAQFVVAAQADINKHQALLGNSATLAATLDITKSLQQADETLVQTYARLQVETAALRDSLALTGSDIGKTGAEFVKFADSAALAAGGVDKLQSLTQSFAQAFYTTQELAHQQIANLAKARDAALAALGIGSGTTRDQFRALYEAALSTMTPQQLVQWQQAGVLLGQAADAQKAYNDQIAQNAETVKSILAQINPNSDPSAGTWTATLANINASYDAAIEKMKAAGATVDQLAKAEMYRAQAAAKTKEAAEQAYDDLVGQIEDGFKSLVLPSSTIAQAIDAIGKAETDTVKQLNAAAVAAGRQGAAEADLAKVHAYASAQATRAIEQFRSSVQQQGGQLGYIKTVDSLNAQIAALQNQLQSATGSFSDATNAVSSAAQDLADSLKLALGDLSPYTDEKKLQIALQGLASGTASREDVLQIGRRLYASSDRYTDLYNRVMGMPDLTKTAAPSGNGGYNGPSIDSGAIEAQILELTKQRDAMQAQQTKAEALAYAQQIADLASADKIGAGQELTNLGINVEKLAKDLGVSSDALAAYIDAMKRDNIGEVIKDVGKELVAAIREIGKQDFAQPISPALPPPRASLPVEPPSDPKRDELNSNVSGLATKVDALLTKLDKLTDARDQVEALDSIASATADMADGIRLLRRSQDDLANYMKQTA